MRRSTVERAIPVLLLAALAVAPASCRSPQQDQPWVPDAGEFDAGADDAGPGALCPPGTPDLFNNAYSPYMGGEESVDLEVVDFSYFRCHVCATFEQIYHELWNENPEYRERVRFYFHHFPFTGQTAWQVHAATVAAANQSMDAFWAMHDHLYDGMNSEPVVQYTPAELREFADEVLGLDMALYDADVDDPTTWAFLEWERGQLEAQGYAGTPSVFICGEKVYWEDVEDAIDSYLDGAK